MSRFNAQGTVPGVISISDAMHPSRELLIYTEANANALIDLLKAAKAKAWPKPLKPLCPASEQLLVYLKAHGDITPIKAREELGIEHLPRRIKDLKEHGHDIKTDYKRGFAGKRYGRYVYTKPDASNA
ncbi:MAG TPA: helix-turn-helix domain-containing protein [Archangium sp.]